MRSAPFLLLLLYAAPSLQGQQTSEQLPQLSDSRLQLILFAENPDIVTPIGMAIDASDRVFVIESHTHMPPSDYPGPDSDRIKIFIDEDNDGQAEKVSVFAEGLHQAMNLAFSPDGELYVACAREVLHLQDSNGDGVCDRRQRVLELQTQERYAHNCLMGITFDREGWMYVSRGNVASRYHRLQGTDGSYVEGYGDGGNVVRCRGDGTRVEEVATGFWNPFDLKFDRQGNLLLVDNDPDARGPNRLVQIVAGGDYGYKSLFGGSGNHPFQAWEGELPGTLPFIEGTGEAPSGVLDCRRAALPADYQDAILSTVWNENSVELFHLEAHGATLTCRQKSVFLSGPQDFRPVAIECDSRGNLYITDWMKVDYPNHGYGRIWRIHCPAEAEPAGPQPYFAPYLAGAVQAALHQLDTAPIREVVAEVAQSGDSFSIHAVVQRLASDDFASERRDLLSDTDASVRLIAFQAQRATASSSEGQPYIAQALQDEDEAIRSFGLIWASESGQSDLKIALRDVLKAGDVSAHVFQLYCAAHEVLSPEFISQYRIRSESRSKDLPRAPIDEVVWQVAHETNFRAEIRALAIRAFSDGLLKDQRDWMIAQLVTAPPTIGLAIMDKIRQQPAIFGTDAILILAELALDEERPVELRCDALLSLSVFQVPQPGRFSRLLHDSEQEVTVEAARAFRAWFEAGVRIELEQQALPELVQRYLGAELREHLGVLAADGETRPRDIQAWEQWLANSGNPQRGRRIFFTPRTTCARCHTIDGSGGELGPDLSQVARSKNRQQIIAALLDPSAEFPPQYQAWLVLTIDGEVHRGLQLDHKAGGDIALFTENGENAVFKAADIDQYRASASSLMPAGLVETMTADEVRDLVAFLTSLK